MKKQIPWLIAASLSLSLLACSQSTPVASRRLPAEAASPATPAGSGSKTPTATLAAAAQVVASGNQEVLKLKLSLPFRTQLATSGQLAYVSVAVRGQGIVSPFVQSGPALVPVSGGEVTLTVPGLPRIEGRLRVITLQGYDADQNPLEAFELAGHYRSSAATAELSPSLSRRELLLGRVLKLMLSTRPADLDSLDIDGLQANIDLATGYDPAGRRLFTTDPGRFDATALAALIPPGSSPLPAAAIILSNALPPLQTVSLDLETPKGRDFGEAVTLTLDDPVSKPTVLDSGSVNGASVSIAGVPRGNWNLRAYASDGELLAQTPVSVDAGGVTVSNDPLSVTGVQELILPLLVNTETNGDQKRPIVAMDADGGFVIVWQSQNQDGSGLGIFAQRFDSDGVAVGAEFPVNQWTTGNQRNADIALDADGDFLIAWESNGQDGSGYGIVARRFASDGTPKGNEYVVNTTTASSQLDVAVALDADGDAVIGWVALDADGIGVFAQRFDAGDTPQGAEFQVNQWTTNFQQRQDVAMDADGDFVFSWDSYGQDGSREGIFARRYTSAGSPVAAEFQVSVFTTNSQIRPSVALDADGDFVISWDSLGQDGSYFRLYARRYNATGTALSGEFQVSASTDAHELNSSVAMDSDGDFTIAWQHYFYDYEFLESRSDVYLQRYTADGSPAGGSRRVNPDSSKMLGQQSVARNDSSIVVPWSDDDDGSGYGVLMMRYDADGNPI